MKIHLETGNRNDYVIQAYGPGSVRINSETYTTSLVLAPDTLVTDWPPLSVALLEPPHLTALLDLRPELILLGIGTRLQFPPPEKLSTIMAHGIGYEVMDTGAACRTYNILMNEGRRVVAGLIIETGD